MFNLTIDQATKRMTEITAEISRLGDQLKDLEAQQFKLFKREDICNSAEYWEWWKKNGRPLEQRQSSLRGEFLTWTAKTIKVGDYVSLSPYTDWHSYKVIGRTECTLTIQERGNRKFTNGWQDGTMTAEDNPNGRIIKLHWSVKRGWWKYNIHKVALGIHDYEDPSF